MENNINIYIWQESSKIIGAVSPIILHVTDWNQKAIRLYEKTGFRIVKMEEVVR